MVFTRVAPPVAQTVMVFTGVAPRVVAPLCVPFTGVGFNESLFCNWWDLTAGAKEEQSTREQGQVKCLCLCRCHKPLEESPKGSPNLLRKLQVALLLSALVACAYSVA